MIFGLQCPENEASFSVRLMRSGHIGVVNSLICRGMLGLSSISIGKFKAFGPTQKVPIRPITLIYGQNSSGKSSIIDAILFASHLAKTGVPSMWSAAPFDEVDYDFKITGNRVKLGTFQDFVYGNKDMDELTLSFTFKLNKRETEITIGLDLDGVCKYSQAIPPGVAFFDLDKSEARNAGHPVWNQQPTARLILNPESDIVAKAVRQATEWLIKEIENHLNANPTTETAEMLKDTERYRNLLTEDMQRKLRAEIAEKFCTPAIGLDTFPPGAPRRLFRYLEEEGVGDDGFWSNMVDVHWPAGLGEAIDEVSQRVFDGITLQLLEKNRIGNEILLKGALEGVVFCGPHREAVPLDNLFPTHRIPEGKFGDLYRIGGWLLGRKSISYFNRWLKKLSRKEAWYELRVRDSRFRDDRHGGVRLQLIDKKRGMEVNLDQIGSGIGQIIPVVLAAAGYNDSTICVKQPELHLHPALQAEVADIFIENCAASRSNGNNFILETHSEHLLLRILRRIRQTQNNEAPSKLRVKSPDVAVLYVENAGNHSVVREMPLSETGELLHDWPGGFFEEGLREVLY